VEGDSGIVARTYGTCVLIERTGTLAASSRSLQNTSSTPRRGANGSPNSDGVPVIIKDGSFTPSTIQSALRNLDIIEDSPAPSDTNRSPKSPKTTTSLAAAPLHNPNWWREALEAAVRHRDSQEEGDVQLLTMRDFDTYVRVRLGE